MLGSKLRSWMEAVRPRKKQQRKEKSLKSNLTNSNGAVIPISQSIYSSQSSENEILVSKIFDYIFIWQVICYEAMCFLLRRRT